MNRTQVVTERRTTPPPSVSDMNHDGASVFADRRQHDLRINLIGTRPITGSPIPISRCRVPYPAPRKSDNSNE